MAHMSLVGDRSLILHTDGHFTQSPSDFLVNPAKPDLLGGGGLDQVIHTAAGRALLQACQEIHAHDHIRCPTGEARITRPGNLSQVCVIHTVGPKITKHVTNHDKQKLWDSYTSSLKASDAYCRFAQNPTARHDAWLDGVKAPKQNQLQGKIAKGGPVSITFPCISTGSYGYPPEKAARIAVKAIKQYFVDHPTSLLKEVHISCMPGQKDIPHLIKAM